MNTQRLIAGEYDYKKYHGRKYLKVLHNDKAFGEYITNIKIARDRLPTIQENQQLSLNIKKEVNHHHDYFRIEKEENT